MKLNTQLPVECSTVVASLFHGPEESQHFQPWELSEFFHYPTRMTKTHSLLHTALYRIVIIIAPYIPFIYNVIFIIYRH